MAFRLESNIQAIPAPIGGNKIAISLTSDLTLGSDTPVWCFITPDMDAWDVILPDAPRYGILIIKNTSDTFSFIVKDSGDVTVATLAAGEIAWLVTDTEVTP